MGHVGVGHAGVWWVMQGWGGSCRGGVGHTGEGWVIQWWGGSCRVGWVMQEWGGSCRGGWVMWGEVGHTGVGWVIQGWSGSCRGGVGHAGVGWVGHAGWGGSDLAEVLDSPPVGHYKGKHDYKMHIYHDHKKFFTLQPQNKGLGTSRGQIHVLPMTWGVEALGAPFR